MNESAPRPPASWVLNETTRATVTMSAEDRVDVLVERLHGPGAALLTMTYRGRMLVNGTDVDLRDDFPAYLGYFDIFSDMGDKVPVGTSVIMDHENMTQDDSESYMGLMHQIDILARRMEGISSSGDTYPVLREMLSAIEDGDTAEDNSPIPPEGDVDQRAAYYSSREDNPSKNV